MAVDSISNTTNSATTGIEQSGFGGLQSDDFIKVLITEMSNQDPFEPSDSAAVLDQLSSLRDIESQMSLQESIESLVLQNSLSQAGSLIGREIEGLTESNTSISGIVTAVQIVDGKAELELEGGLVLAMDRVTSVRQAGT